MATTSCVFLVVLSFFISSSLCGLSCLDSKGSPVDWFAALKQPNGYDTQVFNGKTFQAGGSLQSGQGHIGNTLRSLYSCSGCGYAMYNDQTPDSNDHDSNAHMKGALAFDGTSGFWLVHSVPRFTGTKSNGYSFPVEQTKYGQSFLCISLGTSEFNTIGKAFQIDYPFIYDSNMPASLAANVPALADYIRTSTHNTTPGAQVFTVKSLGGNQFNVFAKNRQWNKELYEYLVAPHFGAGMMVETWQNGIGKIGSYCKPQYPFSVINVISLSFPDGTKWKETQDHAKWGITNQGNNTCIGDINRADGQLKRGGGTVCFHHLMLWNAFYNIIETADNC